MGPPLYALLGKGLLASASVSASPLPASTRSGCTLLRQFFRLLRVAAENRGAADLVPSLSSLCLSEEMQGLVLNPALTGDLAPAYFGLLRQVHVVRVGVRDYGRSKRRVLCASACAVNCVRVCTCMYVYVCVCT